MRVLAWLLRLIAFVVLLVFALRNQHAVKLNGLVGDALTLPLIVALLVAFLLGAALGLSGLWTAWWRERRKRPPAQDAGGADSVIRAPDDRARIEAPLLEHPPRDGL